MTIKTLRNRVDKIINRIAPTRERPPVALAIIGDGLIREISAGGQKITLDPPYENVTDQSTERDYIAILQQHGIWNDRTMDREEFLMIKYIPFRDKGELTTTSP